MSAATITATGLQCATGDQAFSLHGAVAAGINVAAPDRWLTAPSLLAEQDYVPILTTPIGDLEATHPFHRLAELSYLALDEVLEGLAESLDGKAIDIATVLAPISSARGNLFDRGLFETTLSACLDAWRERSERAGPAEVRFRYINAADGVSAALNGLLAPLRAGESDAVIFGGADTLVNDRTCHELSESFRLLTTESANGLVLGEAAAYLIIESTAPKADASRVLGTIESIAAAPEPHVHQAKRERLDGLFNSLDAALKLATYNANDLSAIIQSLGAETTGEREWHAVLQRLYPKRLPEQQRVAMMLGEVDAPDIPDNERTPELRPYVALGDIGAAALPVSLALACAKFEHDKSFAAYGFEPPGAVAVCEAGDWPMRGAVILSPPAEKGDWR